MASFRVNVAVGALYCQYYVDVRQRCYYMKNEYSFKPIVLSYEVVSWSVSKSQRLWLTTTAVFNVRQKQDVLCNGVFCGLKWIAVVQKNCAVIVVRSFYIIVSFFFPIVIVVAKSIKASFTAAVLTNACMLNDLISFDQQM